MLDKDEDAAKQTGANPNTKDGSTKIIIDFSEGDKSYIFELKEKRKIDHNLLNSLNIAQISK